MAHLREDAAFDVVEKWEKEAKDLIGAIAGSADVSDAVAIAEVIRDTGFITKCKSYAIKAAHPFGYSVFLQNPAEGFSFQRHVAHKVETFHILKAHAGAVVFLCPYGAWLDLYSAGRIDAWLSGVRDEELQQYATTPQPGDVYHVDELSVVHTVLGCDLEEFANTSTDMVERLHDQNEGRAIPCEFNRAYMTARLHAITPPPRSHEVRRGVRRPIEPVDVGPFEMTTLANGPIYAVKARLQKGSRSPVSESGDDAVAIHVWAGSGRLLLGNATISLTDGDISAVMPGCMYRFESDADRELFWSEQRVSLDQALV